MVTTTAFCRLSAVPCHTCSLRQLGLFLVVLVAISVHSTTGASCQGSAKSCGPDGNIYYCQGGTLKFFALCQTGLTCKGSGNNVRCDWGTKPKPGTGSGDTKDRESREENSGGGGGQGSGSKTGGGKGGGGGTGGGSDKPFCTEAEFDNAVTGLGFPKPTHEQYKNCVGPARSAGGITSKREFAMFLTQILWESGGLQYKEEIACKQTKCPGSYKTPDDCPGKYYYCRGYIQLSWHYNYKAASEALFGDDRLVCNPDLVASNDSVAWRTAFWYWKANVHNAPGVQQGQFGSSTNAINGGLECRGAYRHKAAKRFENYKKVLKALNLNDTPNSAGC